MFRKFVAAATALAAVTVALILTAVTGASLSPPTATLTIQPGTSATETKVVTIPAKPGSADVEIAIDTTGSMGGTIAQAKADAINIVNGVQGSVPDTQFAVVEFKDSGDTPEYSVVQAMTSSASAVSTAVNTLSAGGGGDAPEAYNLVFRNSYTPATGGALGWRTGSRKFVVVIGDAQPHGDLATQGLGPCSNVSADPHGLVTSTELAGMNTNGRTLLMIRQPGGAPLACYQKLAAGGFTGGAAVDSGGSLATQIVSLIDAAVANVNNVHLEVASAGPAPAAASWITLPPALGPVPAPSTQTFAPLTVGVPTGTPAGTYTFDIAAVADGVDSGHQALTVVVPAQASCASPTITGSGVIVGTSGDDVIVGSPGGDVILGNGGNDVICAGQAGDVVFGGDGNDTIYGDDGKPADADAPGGGDALFGGNGNDTIHGEAAGDSIHGEAGDDTLDGNGGGDSVLGGAGNDKLDGGEGNDSLDGGDGNDTLTGGPGNDALSGGAGDDYVNSDLAPTPPGTLDPAASADSCNGGPGTDGSFGCESKVDIP
jgi:Ca2+-binding RTX toxin-like protein